MLIHQCRYLFLGRRNGLAYDDAMAETVTAHRAQSSGQMAKAAAIAIPLVDKRKSAVVKGVVWDSLDG
jgi:hypothetical protein